MKGSLQVTEIDKEHEPPEKLKLHMFFSVLSLLMTSPPQGENPFKTFLRPIKDHVLVNLRPVDNVPIS